MSATTHTVVVRPSSVFSTEKKKGGAALLTSTAVTALAGVSATTTVSAVLDILSEVVEANRAVTNNSVGRAGSTQF